MYSCGYNGWVDVPEEEREELDAFEASLRRLPAAPVLPPSPTLRFLPSRIPDRKAA